MFDELVFVMYSCATAKFDQRIAYSNMLICLTYRKNYSFMFNIFKRNNSYKYEMQNWSGSNAL